MKVLGNGQFDFGKFRLDTANKVLRHEDKVVALPLKAVELLCLLIENHGEVVSKQEIFDKVWQNSFVEDSVLTQNIYTLRKTFEEFGEADLIKTLPRRGYLFKYERSAPIPLKIEREIYEEIEVIEEIEDEKDLALPDAKKSKFKPVHLLIGVIILLTVTGFGFWVRLAKNTEKKSLSEIKSIVILPLKSLTENEHEKVLANGIREKIAAGLGNLNDLKVLSADGSEAEIDKLNNFDAVLLGTLQQNDDKVRVNLRLLQTKNSAQIWAGTFIELKTDIFQLQDKISDEVARTLSRNLSKQDREILFKRETDNREAYDNYLQGRYFFNQRGDDYLPSLKKAEQFFEKAVELDPNFAEAYIGLADTINLQTDSENKFDANYDASYKKSKELISKALAINPNLAEAYSAIGWIQFRYEWNFAEAEKSFLRAVEINPDLPNVYLWLSAIFSVKGDSEKAIFYAEKAVELEPSFSKALGNLATTYAYNGQCDKAVELLPRIAQYMTSEGNRFEQEGNVLSICGRCEESVPILLKAKEKFPRGRVVAYSLGYCFAKMNQPEKAAEEIKILEIEPVTGFSLYGKILIHQALGENEKALSVFSEFYKTRDARNLRVFYDPRLEELRNDRKFKEITGNLRK